MILPPLYGASLTNSDKSWDTLRVSYLSVDALKHPSPNVNINITTFNLDIIKYINPDTRILNVTQLNCDLIKYKAPDLTVEVTNMVSDLMTYSKPNTVINLSSISIDLLRY